MSSTHIEPSEPNSTSAATLGMVKGPVEETTKFERTCVVVSQVKFTPTISWPSSWPVCEKKSPKSTESKVTETMLSAFATVAAKNSTTMSAKRLDIGFPRPTKLKGRALVMGEAYTKNSTY